MTDNRQHSRFGGSVCDRYMNCPGSVALNASVPKKPSTKYADKGTVVHKLAEICIRKSCHPNAFLGREIPHVPPGFPIDMGMADSAVTYINAVETEMARTKTAQWLAEQGFRIPMPWEPEGEAGEVWGSNDLLVYHPEIGRLRVFDYKNGYQPVTADDNRQLKFYCLGAILANPTWNIREIVLTIVQPNGKDVVEQGVEPVKDWTFDVIDVLEFQAELVAGIAKARDLEQRAAALDAKWIDTGDAFHPGSWCRWCDGAALCPAKEQQALAAATLDFEGVTTISGLTPGSLPSVRDVPLERLARIVAGIDVVSTWQAQAQEYLEGLVLGGVDVPGWKAVEKIGRAKWIDDPAQVASYAELMFEVDHSQMMPPKLVTIGDAEKLLKARGATKEQIDDFKLRFTLKESSGLTVAPASDRRPAANPVKENFGGVDTAALSIAAE